MLVEIPEPEVILSVILAFLVGLGVLYGFFKVRPFIQSKGGLTDATQTQRLEYYERQLIDMKIRLDAIEIQGVEQKTEDPNRELKEFLERLASNKVQAETADEPKTVPEKPTPTNNVSGMDHTNPTVHVLQLITNNAMTSRDIQVTLNRSREHTSRLMKKLFEDGFVERNVQTKPYTYSITEKGKARVNELQPSPAIAQ